MDEDRLKKQLDFILETDKSKDIFRQTYAGISLRNENDAEHAWHLAVMAMLLCEYSNRPVNIERVMKMVIIHDLVEIDAGDTYAYDIEANKTKRTRELRAADRIFNILPEDQAKEIRALWDEFEEAQTDDAKFAVAIDVMHPIIINDLGNGAAWRDHFVTKEQVDERITMIKPGSEVLYEECVKIIERNIAAGNIIQ